ncbi:MAG: VOC family protein [Nannocystaceae bacterium]|nr:VOC family protein [bacterium]
MIKELNSIIMYSQDLEAAKRWYREVLGFELLYHVPHAFLSMRHPQMGRLDFHPTDDPANIGKGPLPNYAVDDVAAVKAWLEGNGVKVSDVQQVNDSPRHAWFWDHEGNVLGLEEN